MQVTIKNGLYRGIDINGTFEVVKPWCDGARGGYITVKADDSRKWETRTPRISVAQEDCITSAEESFVDDCSYTAPITQLQAVNHEQELRRSETKEEAMERIRHSFTMLSKVTDSVAQGIIRGLVVSGPPGIGKSHGVEEQLKMANLFNVVAAKKINYEIVSGAASPIGLYQKLWEFKDAGNVVCFDDCDSVLFDEDCLNLLKCALNSGSRRRLCWNKESRVLDREDIPDAFDFEGSIIFLTNINFETVRGGRIADHLKAIISRCHYMDLEIGSTADKLLRIEQIVNDGMLNKFNFANNEEKMIVDWIHENKNTLRELSLRMVTKIAELVKAHKNEWEEYAVATTLTREAKFARLNRARALQSSVVTTQAGDELTAD